MLVGRESVRIRIAASSVRKIMLGLRMRWSAATFLGLSWRTMPAVLGGNARMTVAGVILFATCAVMSPPVGRIAPSATIPVVPLGIAATKSNRRARHLG